MPDYPRYDRNVFQIAYQAGKLPLFVRANHWKRDSYFQVIAVRYTKKQMDYFEKTGRLYGTAVGYFYREGKRISASVEILRNAGVYKWNEVFEADIGRLMREEAKP